MICVRVLLQVQEMEGVCKMPNVLISSDTSGKNLDLIKIITSDMSVQMPA